MKIKSSYPKMSSLKPKKHIVIIGNGIAGTTCARFIRKYSQHNISIISSESEFFFSRPALMYLFMGKLSFKETKPYEDSFWQKNNINLIFAQVEKVFNDKKEIHIKKLLGDHLEKIEILKYDELVLATGSKIKKLNIDNEDAKGIQGFYSLQDVSLLHKNCELVKNAVIIGGGLIGVEVAEMLIQKNIQVHFLIKDEYFFQSQIHLEEAKILHRHIESHHVKIFKKSQVEQIIVNENNKVSNIIFKKDDKLYSMSCQLLVIAIGVEPNTSLSIHKPLKKDIGYLVDSNLKTSDKNIYAIGDCVQLKNTAKGRKSTEALWYTARNMGEIAAYNICHNEKMLYDQGIWFNSAKFFEIEYQIYGSLFSTDKKTNFFYWENKGQQVSFRITFNHENENFLGIQTLSIRLRQETAQEWISQKVKVSFVIENLRKIIFDPEFFQKFDKEIQIKFQIFLNQKKDHHA